MDFILLTTDTANTEIVHYSKDIVKNLFLPATISGVIFTLLRTAVKNFNQTPLESKISSNTEKFLDYCSLAFVTGLGYLLILIITSKLNLLESGVLSFLGVLFALLFLFLAKWIIIPKATVEARLKSNNSNDFDYKIVKKIGKDKYLCSKKDLDLREIYFFTSNLEDYEFNLKVHEFSKKQKTIRWIIFICTILLIIVGLIVLAILNTPK